ncbi:hypothetical protein [Pectinatus sottacetonis]|nr:hypothetical protein [Pectinatus sottacetonis]
MMKLFVTIPYYFSAGININEYLKVTNVKTAGSIIRGITGK